MGNTKTIIGKKLTNRGFFISPFSTLNTVGIKTKSSVSRRTGLIILKTFLEIFFYTTPTKLDFFPFGFKVG